MHQAPHPLPACTPTPTSRLLLSLNSVPPCWTLSPKFLGIWLSHRLRRRGLGVLGRRYFAFLWSQLPGDAETAGPRPALSNSLRPSLAGLSWTQKIPGPHSGHRTPWPLVPQPVPYTHPARPAYEPSPRLEFPHPLRDHRPPAQRRLPPFPESSPGLRSLLSSPPSASPPLPRRPIFLHSLDSRFPRGL